MLDIITCVLSVGVGIVMIQDHFMWKNARKVWDSHHDKIMSAKTYGQFLQALQNRDVAYRKATGYFKANK
jgi:hypothetical protein